MRRTRVRAMGQATAATRKRDEASANYSITSRQRAIGHLWTLHEAVPSEVMGTGQVGCVALSQ